MTREEAIKVLNTYDVNFEEYIAEEIADAIDMAIEALHREEAEEKGYCHRIMPRNVEVVVRCKDCKYWEGGCKESGNGIMMAETEADDFCSYGERKGGEDE